METILGLPQHMPKLAKMRQRVNRYRQSRQKPGRTKHKDVQQISFRALTAIAGMEEEADAAIQNG